MALRHTANRGLGIAFQSAVAFAIENQYDMMINIDGDRQFDPADIPKLVAPIEEGKVDMVTASRFLDPTFIPKMPRVKRIGNNMMSFLISRLVRARYADVSCGFRCCNREVETADEEQARRPHEQTCCRPEQHRNAVTHTGLSSSPTGPQ